MTENQTGEEIKRASLENEVSLNTSYRCPHCASGAEKYSELFDHGTCRNCGGPLEQFYSTLTEKGEKEIRESVLLIYSQEDMKENAAKVIKDLNEHGIKVIDANDIIEGSQTSVISGNLSFVMDKASSTLVIPSAHIEDDVAIRTCLANAIMQRIERAKTIIPVYFEGNSKIKPPFGLVDIAGINWDGKAHREPFLLDKPRAIDDLKKLIW